MAEAGDWYLTGLVRSSAVVQHDCPVLVRGRAPAGLMVRVTLAGHQVDAQADASGQWHCRLPGLPTGGPYEGQVVGQGQETIPLTDLWAGEIWLCAGQSNMAMVLAALEADEQPSESEVGLQPVVRMANIMPRVAAVPEREVKTRWLDAAEWPRITSGVGYHFARTLASTLGRPVGIVQAAIGHTPAMAWTSRDEMTGDSSAGRKLATFDEQLATVPGAREDLEAWRQKLGTLNSQWNRAVSAWLPVARAAFEAGQPFDPMPAFPDGLGNAHTPTVLYNAMIAPLAGEAMAGVFWYQGESDAILGMAREYERSLAGLKAGFRKLLGPVPLVVVELPRHMDIQCEDPDDAWPRVRWAQQQSLSDPQVGVVPAIDLGATRMIHPTRKKTLAMRAATVALGLAYADTPAGKQARRHGPVLQEARFDADSILLKIKGVKGKLMHHPLEEGTPARFEVLSEDRWHPLSYELTARDQIKLRGPEQSLRNAQAVRYAWEGDPLVEVFDEDHWPLSPFQAWRNGHSQEKQS